MAAPNSIHYETLEVSDKRATREYDALRWWLRTFAPGRIDCDEILATPMAVMARELKLGRTNRYIASVHVYDSTPAETLCWANRVYGSGGLDEDELESAVAVFAWEANDTYTMVYAWDDCTQQTVLELQLASIA